MNVSPVVKGVIGTLFVALLVGWVSKVESRFDTMAQRLELLIRIDERTANIEKKVDALEKRSR
jgi:hypothetical protein